eukprot:GEMP01098618.1.p1 GENE.GEMP01098618.1~~GEMP01098618.1.p1  ORF type:complete len:103 (-),score=4.98 GEMP01098618.1:402-710(-)
MPNNPRPPNPYLDTKNTLKKKTKMAKTSAHNGTPESSETNTLLGVSPVSCSPSLVVLGIFAALCSLFRKVVRGSQNYGFHAKTVITRVFGQNKMNHKKNPNS